MMLNSSTRQKLMRDTGWCICDKGSMHSSSPSPIYYQYHVIDHYRLLIDTAGQLPTMVHCLESLGGQWGVYLFEPQMLLLNDSVSDKLEGDSKRTTTV